MNTTEGKRGEGVLHLSSPNDDYAHIATNVVFWVLLTRGSSGGPGCDASRTPSSVRVKFWYLRSDPVSVTFNFNAYLMVADMATHLYIAWSSSFWLAQVNRPPPLLKNWNKLSEIIGLLIYKSILILRQKFWNRSTYISVTITGWMDTLKSCMKRPSQRMFPRPL